MDHGIVRRILKGFGANLYGQAVIVIVQLLGVPILLHAWGPQLYGEWLILFAIPAYLSMTDLGFSQSAANDMTAQVARGDRAEALSVFQSLGALVFSAAAIGLLLVTALVFGLPLQHWLHFQAMNIEEVRWVLWFLALSILAGLPDGANHAGFRSHGEYGLHVGIYYTVLLAQNIALWTAAITGRGPVVAAAAFFAIRLLAMIATAALLIIRHRSLHFGFKHARVAELRRLGRPALANLGMPLAQALNVQGMVLAVGALLGPLAVVTFATLRTLTRLALQLASAVSHAAEPEFAAAYGKASPELLRRLFAHALRASFWLALLAVVSLAVSGDFILRFWTDGRVPMNAPLFRWLLLSALASTLWYGALIVLKAANQHLRASFLYSLSASIAVLVAILLLKVTGQLADVGLALLMMDTLMASYMLPAACRHMHAPVWKSLLAAIDPRPLLRLSARSTHVQ